MSGVVIETVNSKFQVRFRVGEALLQFFPFTCGTSVSCCRVARVLAFGKEKAR